MSAVAAGSREAVLAEVDRAAGDLVDALAAAIRIQSVNPKYPGQVYDEVVGAEGDMARFMAEIYRDAGAEVDLFAIEPRRENAVGTITGPRRAAKAPGR